MENRQQLAPAVRRLEVEMVTMAQQRHDERARARSSRGEVAARATRSASSLATIAQRHPLALACAAGALGFAAGWLAGRAPALSRSPAIAWRRLNGRRDGASTTARRIAHINKSLASKPHGEKLANAARAAATRTRAPTYPEG